MAEVRRRKLNESDLTIDDDGVLLSKTDPGDKQNSSAAESSDHVSTKQNSITTLIVHKVDKDKKDRNT